MIIWSTSTGSAGSADTRELAATEAVTSVLEHWSAQAHDEQPRTTAVTIDVDTEIAIVGPGRTERGDFDEDGTRQVLATVTTGLAHVQHDEAQTAPAH